MYVAVFAALMTLLGLTLAGHFLHWGLAAALLIAACKALLVGFYFMHLRFSSRVVQCAACVGLIWLALLVVLALSDYATRHWNQPLTLLYESAFHYLVKLALINP